MRVLCMNWIAGKYLDFPIFGIFKQKQFPSGPSIWQGHNPTIQFKHIRFEENGCQKL
jgi:hypothetical protein